MSVEPQDWLSNWIPSDIADVQVENVEREFPQAADVTFKKAQRVRPDPSETQKDLPMGSEPSEE